MARYVARLIETTEELERLAYPWQALAGGIPFCEPEWLTTWWTHFGELSTWMCGPSRLFVVAVESEARLIGLAPWYVESRPLNERVLRWLGSGEVCSEYLSVLALKGEEVAVADAVTTFLCDEVGYAWDRIEFDAAAVDNASLQTLFTGFVRRGVTVERRPGPSLWRVPLTGSWETYLGSLSKSHRKQLRRLTTNVLQSDRATWHTTRYEAEFDRDWAVLVDLHARRRRSFGELGNFANARYAAFHESIARRLLRRGRLRMHRLELDGRPIAAEYHLAGRDTVFAYQSGLDPAALDEEPGRLAAIAAIQAAMSEGFSTYDLLRGDEPYKAHWRAVPTATEQVTVVAPRLSSQVRNAVRREARRWKRALRRK